MRHRAKSVRTFIGAKDYNASRAFYIDLGFEEHIISKDMSYFKIFDAMGFYLQDYYARDWVNNSMLFLEVDDVERYWDEVQALGLTDKYKGSGLYRSGMKSGEESFSCTTLRGYCGILASLNKFFLCIVA